MCSKTLAAMYRPIQRVVCGMRWVINLWVWSTTVCILRMRATCDFKLNHELDTTKPCLESPQTSPYPPTPSRPCRSRGTCSSCPCAPDSARLGSGVPPSCASRTPRSSPRPSRLPLPVPHFSHTIFVWRHRLLRQPFVALTLKGRHVVTPHLL